jgi:S-disulfanyl-L-cysteine oxidoreductase SoxD
MSKRVTGLKGWTAAAMLCMLAVLTRDAAAQTQAPVAPARSTRAGVYTAEQANRGRDIYAGMCQACHPATSHTGVTFKNSWGGRPLSDLFGFIRERMPKNEPGSLAAEEYADVLAYLLKLNAMPAGDRELPPDSLILKRIRIDTGAVSR